MIKYFSSSCLMLILTMLLLSNSAFSYDEGGDTSSQCVRPAQDCQCTEGIFGALMVEIMGMIEGVHQQMYEGLLNSGLQEVAGAVILLFVVLSGVLFVMGMIQLNLAEITKRSLKLVIIGALLSSSGWALFNETVVPVFTQGRDEIITIMTDTMQNNLMGGALSGGACTINMGQSSEFSELQESARKIFEPMDGIMMKLICPQTMILFEAAINSSAYGIMFGGAYAMIGLFIAMAFARALWVYLVATLATFLLLGLAPFFLISLLFERTKSFFQNWINFLVSFSLQPIFMFTGMTFFVLLMQAPLEEGLLSGAAVHDTIDEVTQGGASEFEGWVLADPETCMAFQVEYNINGCETQQASSGQEQACEDNNIPGEFPLDIMDAIIMLLLGFISFKLYDQVLMLAQDISSAIMSLEAGSPVQQATSGITSQINQGVSGMISKGISGNN